MSARSVAAAVSFAENVRSVFDSKRAQRISAGLAAGVFVFACALGALLAFLSGTSTGFIFTLGAGSIGSCFVYGASRGVIALMSRRRLRAIYADFLQELTAADRILARDCFSNLITIGYAVEQHSKFIMNLVSESFDFDKDSMRQIMSISASGKIVYKRPTEDSATNDGSLAAALEPSGKMFDSRLSDVLEESVLAMEQLFILFDAGIYDDQPQLSKIVPGLKRQLLQAESLSVMIEKCLIFEKEIVRDIQETLQFCLNVIGQPELKSNTLTQNFVAEREVRRKNLHESFYQFMASIPRAPIDFSQS